MRIGVMLLVVPLLGCSPDIPPVTPELLARHPTADAAQLERGRTILLTRCTTCHAAREPRRLRPDQWPSMLDIMAPRAYLPPTDRNDLQAYLLVASQEP
jgi:hypothetical protein